MYRKIFVPVDNSEHSNSAVEAAVTLARTFGSEVVGHHAYAAKLHDVRFKQMEFTLPEEYQDETELEHQRKIHDSLITMGLRLISDSYLDVLQRRCEEEEIPFTPRTFDGKNYRVLVDDIRTSDYDLVVMGALGVGAVKESLIGSVTERVVRRTQVDTLVMRKAPGDDEGGIVVAVDGSPQSFSGLRTGLAIAKALDRPIEAIAVYDPYLHYAMFNGLVSVLSEKAAKIFKFKEQEALHEEVIDTGLAKIYQSHLEVTKTLARDEGVDIKTTLLDGKAFEKVLGYVRKTRPWLLICGRIGVHSDEDMDIGSNSENLLRLAPTNVLLSSGVFIPPVDLKAESAISWTEEAQGRMARVPAMVRGIARTAIHRYAMEKGHSIISTSVFEKAIGSILPEPALRAMGIIADGVAYEHARKTDMKTFICAICGYVAKDDRPVACPVCGVEGERFNVIDRKAVESVAPLEGDFETEETFDGVKLTWTSEARKILQTTPSGYARRRAKAKIEKTARVRRLDTITTELASEVIEAPEPGAPQSPVAVPRPEEADLPKVTWTDAATERLDRVPLGFMRELTKDKVEEVARERGSSTVTAELAEEGIAQSRELMNAVIGEYMGGDDADREALREAHGHGPAPASPSQADPSLQSPSHGQIGDMKDAALREAHDGEKEREAGSGDGERKPAWTEEASQKLDSIAEKAAETQKHEPDRAVELGRNLAEERAEESRRSEISGTFMEKLGKKIGYGHPLSKQTFEHQFTWTPEAEARLADVPEFCRELARWRVEWTAVKKNLGSVITPEVMDVKFGMWDDVSQNIQGRDESRLEWEETAIARLENVPDFVKGMVIQSVEGNARAWGNERVTSEVLDKVIDKWIKTGDFHEGQFGYK